MEEVQPPRKKFFRQRAHANPLSDINFPHPPSPDRVRWDKLYEPHVLKDNQVTMVDVGCGYGGMTVELSKHFPSTLILGMEIREKVTAYVWQRIQAMRSHGEGHNCAVVMANAMQTITNFFHKGQLTHFFLLYADPQFKAKKHRRRAISPGLLADYAFVIRPGGAIYTVTDVPELHEHHVSHIGSHPLFRRFTPEEEEADPVVAMCLTSTEEGNKARREGRGSLVACFRRIPNP